ncbi:MAG: MlaD family protein [Treponema sp.]|nr:MlaD family protein [Treponema sp.]
MKFSIRFADKIVGILVILALAILVFVVFMLGSNQRWFAQDVKYRTLLPSASGVSRNMPISYKGFTIGRVKDFKLSDDDRVEVHFTINEEYKLRVVEGSLMEMQSSPIPGLGNAFVFHPGKGTTLIDEGEIIPEINSIEARAVFSQGLTTVAKADDSITNILNQVTGILETVNLSLSGAQGSGQAPLEKIIADVAVITGDVREVTSSLSEQLSPLLSMISSPDGAVGSILSADGPLYSSLASSLNSLSGIIDNLDKATAFIPQQLPQVAVAINELNVALRSVQDILTSVANNPLIRGGIPERIETGPGGASPRNQEF